MFVWEVSLPVELRTPQMSTVFSSLLLIRLTILSSSSQTKTIVKPSIRSQSAVYVLYCLYVFSQGSPLYFLDSRLERRTDLPSTILNVDPYVESVAAELHFEMLMTF